MLDLSIIIVSYNVRPVLSRCLSTLRDSPGVSFNGPGGSVFQAEVIIVDSMSSDGTQSLLRDNFKWVRLIEPGSNVGFARGNNLGIAASSGRYLLLVNPDTEIIGSAICDMLTFMENHPEFAVIGPRLLNADGSTQSSRRRFPNIWTGLFESTFLQDWRLSPKQVLDHFYMTDRTEDQLQEVDWVTGAAMLARREIIERVGAFDDSTFFMYSEELDWQFRIHKAGYRVGYYPEARILHLEAQSSSQVGAMKHIWFNESKIKFYRKHYGLVAALVLRISLLSMFFVALVLESVKFALGHKRTLRSERVQTYTQVIMSGLRG